MNEPSQRETAPAADSGAAAEFLTQFFAGTIHKVELRALPSKDRCFTRNPKEVQSFVNKHNLENIYFGVSTREGGGDKQHCREIPALWCDIDFKDTDESKARDLIQRLTLRPSLLNASGGGLHPYWILDRPAAASDPRIEPTLRGLVTELRGDRAAAEIARIMRLPGTINMKYKPPRLCALIDANWNRRYALSDFERFRDESLQTQTSKSNRTGKWTEGHRHDSLLRKAGAMRARGMSAARLEVELLTLNLEKCSPPLPEEEVKRMAADMGAKPALIFDTTVDNFIGSDVSNAEKFKELQGENVRFCYETSRWYIFDGSLWAPDDGERVLELGEKVSAFYARESAEKLSAGESPAQTKSLFAAALKIRNATVLTRMLETARRKLRVELRHLDANPELLGVAGMVVSTKGGDSRPGSRTHFITMSTKIPYNPEAACPRFEAFLEQISGGRQERVNFIQRAAGYSLTGDTSERCFFLLHGKGCNGKTTLLSILLGVAGDYGGTINSNAFLYNSNSDRIPNDLAALRGKRLVTCSELPEGRYLDENAIKRMTGQDPLKVRFLHHEWFEYTPAFKLWVATNSLPHIHETRRAIWDRIRLIPFDVEIPEEKITPNLAAQILATEAEGVLAWIVRGAVAWFEYRLQPPPDVVKAGADYHEREDVVSEYLVERTELDPDSRISKKALYADYSEWEKPGKPMSKKSFAERVADHKVESCWKGGAKAWKGIRLRD